jgi:predicted alpha/beta-fold hydrolase
MQIFLYFIVAATYQIITTHSFHASRAVRFLHNIQSKNILGRKSFISFSSKQDISNSKMGKTIIKMEPVEVEYNVTRPSGYVLEGTLSFPKDAEQKGPILIFVHGTMSSKDHNFVPDISKKIIQDFGIRSYRYNSRFDRSEFEPDHRYKFSGYNDDIDDLKCVISQLKNDGYTPFCLFGHSRGANDVLLYASEHMKGL